MKKAGWTPADLADKFRRQQEFAADYSPLYACIFGAVADWLQDDSDVSPVSWLSEAARERNAFDVTLLLLAGLHRNILDGVPEVAPLARFYPTVGGELSCGAPEFLPTLGEAMMISRQKLTTFIQTATVQTNETGRGIIWLLPLHYTNWEAVHLVDLGASAGLNLVADRRAYRIIVECGAHLLDVGQGNPVQFLINSRGDPSRGLSELSSLPRLASRTGCDVSPFLLETAEDELMLSAFVWGDQPQRLQRLREGIAALHEVNGAQSAGLSHVPVRLYAANLPDELPAFLHQHIPHHPQYPVVIYNSYMTIYLKDKGSDLRGHIATWAQKQERPVLWLQWEPAWDGPAPPEFGWISWTADLWWQGGSQQWQFAWVQPHGTHVLWLPGLGDWIETWRGS